MSKKLPFHEWMILVLILGLMATLFLFSFLSSNSAKNVLDQTSFGRKVPVTILGAVKKQGCHYIPVGSDMEYALRKAKPSKEADLSALDLKKKIHESAKIIVPRLKSWTIYITGAAHESGAIRIPLNTRVCDLKKILSLCEDADLQSLKSRRYLKHEEVIWIPKSKKNG